MKRFLLLYMRYDSHAQYYAEGLIHLDRSVYVRGYVPEGKESYFDLQGLENHLQNDGNIQFYHIQMID